MVIVLFNTVLCRSVFSTVSFGKLVFRLCAFCVSCFESHVLNQDIKICVTEHDSVILDQVYSILIHEYQHKSRQVNTNQHESTLINTSPTRVKTGLTRVNMNQHESDTSQHEPIQVITSQKQV